MASLHSHVFAVASVPGFVFDLPERVDVERIGRHHARVRATLSDGSEHVSRVFVTVDEARLYRDRIAADGLFLPLA